MTVAVGVVAFGVLSSVTRTVLRPAEPNLTENVQISDAQLIAMVGRMWPVRCTVRLAS